MAKISAWKLVCLTLLSLVVMAGVCIADESEEIDAVDESVEVTQDAAPDVNTTSSVNLDDWNLVTITDLYEVMLPPGWTNVTKEVEIGTVTGIIDEKNPDDIIVIVISDNTDGFTADETSLASLLEDYMKEAKVIPVAEEAFVYTDDYCIGLGIGEDGKTEVMVFRVTQDYLITVVGSYATPETAKEGALTLGLITGSISPL
ncbi:MAG: hypothetical protein JXA44_01650 [Methanospirillaceae archaeon]|nr:hypothetical protein [Methanospirillaceae archaeon]